MTWEDASGDYDDFEEKLREIQWMRLYEEVSWAVMETKEQRDKRTGEDLQWFTGYTIH